MTSRSAAAINGRSLATERATAMPDPLNASHSCIALAVLIALASGGCSNEQVYDTGQSWQREQCDRIMDRFERERCLASNSQSYEDYQRQRAADKTAEPH